MLVILFIATNNYISYIHLLFCICTIQVDLISLLYKRVDFTVNILSHMVVKQQYQSVSEKCDNQTLCHFSGVSFVTSSYPLIHIWHYWLVTHPFFLEMILVRKHFLLENASMPMYTNEGLCRMPCKMWYRPQMMANNTKFRRLSWELRLWGAKKLWEKVKGLLLV